MQEGETIHIHRNVSHDHLHLLLLLVPSIVFALSLTILISRQLTGPNYQAAHIEAPSVLGNSTDHE